MANADFFTNRESKIIEISESGCWIWIGGVDRYGYGRVKVNGRRMSAHRAAFESSKSKSIANKVVMHTCDIRSCVNPEHLVLGSIEENNADMIAKKRHMHGDRHHSSKINEKDVYEIRRLFKIGVSKAKIAVKFSVSERAIYDIANRITWRHL